ncbi:hypothetical protein XNC1_1636 [Xenorhabdus nematophila ATCC 19061]|uniref:Uncharacterized protein n=1 Tax=Xenorhabdus nematophila (strain ATCC 19061 / DSM 3370 / CCUG 14189 / LMG 1036 / NCIMB 9965 / AN6) TaxID=406817 RepID=D3VC45_XENNA|nr:hypothetical protein XNC1_1636 [Xenorhabdus nematophila ATCC 19061]CEK22582.1 hypothetical protein XNC2_1588 [Xenorhabdus nematophila AN6/1]
MWEECLPRSIPISVTFCMIASPERNRDKEYGSQGGGGHLITHKVHITSNQTIIAIFCFDKRSECR